ncbi:28S ribosomal protein S14, mitochondrial-like [Mirounga leonina]|uniref:28S ribosomal protein S14, mitochondrial-like n=1 Tax=Mirounga leonina TaxID=9715 RepID=UPI00156C1E9F|nr:28S ribosomal protein S14, mitochondrial-like [Mirounga leonina]
MDKSTLWKSKSPAEKSKNIIEVKNPRIDTLKNIKIVSSLVRKDAWDERLRINSLRKNTILPKDLQEVADGEIAALPRDSCPVRIRNRCVMTSRPRGVKRRWRLSRIVFRHLADHGQLLGVQQATW